jgi:serine/threonine protein kinase
MRWSVAGAQSVALVGCQLTNETHRMLQVGYDLLVDYWSIGCILFEMLAGMPK